MKTFKNDNCVPVKSWCEDIEDSAMEQINNLSRLPFAFHHVAIMPDAHCGYGMPIGGVLATKGAIIPNAVGVDIGCGVCAYKTPVMASDICEKELKVVMDKIRERIPVGFSSHKEPQSLPYYLENNAEVAFAHISSETFDVNSIIEKARHQAGTLGGGNHFIELQKDQDDFIWVMIHSGSRNVGYTIANYFNSIAKELNREWFHDVSNDLAFLPVGHNETNEYLASMRYAIDFAKYNRRTMMNICFNICFNIFNSDFCKKNVRFNCFYDLSHNYVEIENHFGENVWVHRKGATRARKGDICIIPGSQGSNSYICKGLGNPDSFMSCAHGAGRKMSRSKARDVLNVEYETKLLDKMGVIHAIRSEKDLDEAPSAYKDIHSVMNAQNDLVEILHELTPIAVIKG